MLRRNVSGTICATICATLVAVICVSTVLLHGAFESTAVADAAQRRDADAVRALIRQGADVNAAQGDGMTALHWAAYNGDVAIAETLILAGANLKAGTRINGYTALFLASQFGHAAVIDALLKAGANPNALSVTGSTALMLAAASGDVASVKALVEAGADVNAKETSRGQTAAMFAAAYNRADAIKVLAAHRADLKVTSLVVTQFAAPGSGGRRNRDGVAGFDRPYSYQELIGSHGGLTALLFAAREGHVESVKALLESGADLNQAGDGDHTTPLLIASINGFYDLARMMVDKGANPNVMAANGVTPLYAVVNCQWAAKAFYPQPRAYLQQQTSYLDLMKLLLEKGADPNVRLKKAVWYREYNREQSQVDEIGATPLWRAAYAGDADAIRLLAKYGADPNIPTIAIGQKPNEYTTQGKDLSGLPPLPNGGPAATPLIAAAGIGFGRAAGSTHTHVLSGWLPAVEALVELGVDLNARDEFGDSALHYAAARGDNEMILFLISKGADVKVVDRIGQTVADMANGPTERGVPPLVDTLALLAKHGVTPNQKCVLCS